MVDPQDVTPGEKSPIRHDGPHTFGARSIAKLNADLDLSKYKFGKAFVPFAHELKRAAIIGADGFLKGDGLSSVNDAVNALSDSSQFFLMA